MFFIYILILCEENTMKKLLLALFAFGLLSATSLSTQARDWESCPFPLTLKECMQ